MKDDGGRVIGLEAQNIMQLRTVKIDLQGKNMVMVSGKNEAGKSTALDLFAMVVGGAALCPTEPISRGESEGFAVVEMEGYIATRKFWLTKDNVLASKLFLASRDGAEFKSPKTMLDKILGPLAIDPLEFTRKMLKEPKKARDILLNLAGVEINLDELARARQTLYDERTWVNRNIKDKNGELVGTEPPEPGLLVDEVSVTKITQEYQRAINLKAVNDRERQAITVHESNAVKQAEKIKTLKAGLLKEEGKLDRMIEVQKAMVDDYALLEFIDDGQLAAISQLIEKAEGTNREIREATTQQAKRVTLQMIIESLNDDSNSLTHSIGELDNQKDGALQGAEFPVPGLTVDETGIRFNGFPLAQSSQSERIKVGLAISTKMNPKASLIRIYEGSALDSANLGTIDTFARENNLTILVEVVDETGNVGIVIEDGMVAKIN